MLNHADYLSAIQKRCSRRKYADRQVEDKEIGRLQMAIAAYNEQSGLHMKLVIGNGGELFDDFKKSYGMFVGQTDKKRSQPTYP